MLAQLFQPKSSKLEELLVGKALEAFLSQADLNRRFMEVLLGALAESFGKNAGKRISEIVIREE